MAGDYRDRIRQIRERRIAATLPAPMGEEAIAATEHIKSETTDLASRLALVQAGLAMATAGKTRATVSEVVNLALKDYGVLVMPSVAGQIFSEVGVRRVSVHGERRLVLQAEQLKPLHDDLSADLVSLQLQIEEATERFEGLADQVTDLAARVRSIRQHAERERELRAFIMKYQKDARTIARIEQEYQAAKGRMDLQEKLSAYIQETTKKLKKLPGLEEKAKELAAKVEQHEADEQDLVEREDELAKRKASLDRREQALLGQHRRFDIREGVIETAELEKQLKEKRKELDGVLRQLGEKKGLLGRVLGKGKGEVAP